MQEELVKKITNNPKYHELVAKRASYGWLMTFLVMLVYYGYILTVAFNKAWLGTKLGAGMTTSVGIPLGLGVILATIILTGIYVRRANSEFDDLTNAIVKEAQK